MSGHLVSPAYRLMDRRWRLLNSFGRGAWSDGANRDEIARIEMELHAMVPLTDAQRATLIAAKKDEAGPFWRVDTRSPGARGLVGLGLIFGRAHSSRYPGTFGALTNEGVKARELLLAMKEPDA